MRRFDTSKLLSLSATLMFLLWCSVPSHAAEEQTAKTYTLTVESSNPSSGVSIAVTPADKSGAGKGTTTFKRTYAAGTAVALTAPSAAGKNKFDLWTGCTTSSAGTCKVTLEANATVTAIYAATTAIAPRVTVTPAEKSISSSAALSVSIAVRGPAGKATPAGTVTLTSGSYRSGVVALSSGKATIRIAAGALAAGADTLTATYVPSAASSSIYKATRGSAQVTVTEPPLYYTLSIDSTNPSTGVSVSAIPADKNGVGFGTAPFKLTYKAGTSVQLTATSPSAGGFYFLSWAGCASSTKQGGCTVVMKGNTTITANYNQPSITAIKISPNPAVATIGAPLQLTATVIGTGNFSNGVMWSLSGPGGSNLSAGTLSASGLYITPYPAPAAVTITATSTQNAKISSKVTVALKPPATAAGPALSVDTANQTHAISPLIYGMNGYALDTSVASAGNISVVRWGGDNTSRYNYLNNLTNSASDWYFENNYGTGIWPDGNFADLVTTAASDGIKVVGTVPVLGWATNSSSTACSFPASTYSNQYQFSPDGRDCGDGENPDQSEITGNSATVTSLSEPPPVAPESPSDATQSWAEGSWAGAWVESFVSQSKTGANGGVAIWDLDNEPAWWDAVHRDVHPSPSTYDEVTNGGIGTALAIKTLDPTAQVSGPVIDYWWNYFYSKKDIENGWDSGPCYQPWSGPTDREAHGGAPMIEYYLQQFAKAQTTYGMRLLDYVDLHTYFAATYNGSGVGLAPAGDTGEQEARLNSTRVFWDPTYTDPNFPQPNYKTDPNYYTANCNIPVQAPQLIPMMKTWVANDYPGTKTAITEYNWGGQESIDGAVAQADILGIFGTYGLDMGTLWGPPDPSSQIPGLMAFEIYRNYDSNKSTFGDMALASTSASQGQLSVYGALRTADGALTVMVINKTYGALTSTLTLNSLVVSSGATAQVFQYSNANLNAIVAAPPVAVTPPASGGSASTLTATFPAHSITLLVISK